MAIERARPGERVNTSMHSTPYRRIERTVRVRLESVANRTNNRFGAVLIIGSGNYRVRLARRADLHLLPAVERLAASRFRDVGLEHVYDRYFITAEDFEARQHRGVLWVAVSGDDRPLGFVTCSKLDGAAHLDEIDVLPAHGRRGVGSLLLEAVCAWARSRAYPAITLSTTRAVEWNEGFYQRRGFCELVETAYTDGLRRLRAVEAAAGLPVNRRLIMRKDLASTERSVARWEFRVAKCSGVVI
jgi:GNAT superfamily N-acetyltransferase